MENGGWGKRADRVRKREGRRGEAGEKAEREKEGLEKAWGGGREKNTELFSLLLEMRRISVRFQRPA